VTPSAIRRLGSVGQSARGGRVENYRDRVFKNGGGRVAFFELEDDRPRRREGRRKTNRSLRALLNAGEPVLIEGKVTFPWGPTTSPTTKPERSRPSCSKRCNRSPTRSRPRRAAFHPSRRRAHRPDHLKGLRDVLTRSPGNCPVNVVIDLGDGAQAILSLGATLKVTPNDAMLAGLERLFGENVAELR
jgi:DNA polymerase-3 subunit alpha